jgi:Putative motility protein
MNIAATTAVQAASSAAQAPGAGEAQIAVLKKAMDMQATQAAALLQALPQQPALAQSGALGRNVNAIV